MCPADFSKHGWLPSSQPWLLNHNLWPDNGRGKKYDGVQKGIYPTFLNFARLTKFHVKLPKFLSMQGGGCSKRLNFFFHFRPLPHIFLALQFLPPSFLPNSAPPPTLPPPHTLMTALICLVFEKRTWLWKSWSSTKATMGFVKRTTQLGK